MSCCRNSVSIFVHHSLASVVSQWMTTGLCVVRLVILVVVMAETSGKKSKLWGKLKFKSAVALPPASEWFYRSCKYQQITHDNGQPTDAFGRAAWSYVVIKFHYRVQRILQQDCRSAPPSHGTSCVKVPTEFSIPVVVCFRRQIVDNSACCLTYVYRYRYTRLL